MTSPQELRDIATAIALDAGKLILQRRTEGVKVAATKSTVIDVVTEADKECEAFITERIAQLRPDDGVFGEEGAQKESTSGLTWIIDPIDGTVNYLYNIPAYAVSIAVVEGLPDPATWKQLAGAVYNPVTQELFSAAQGLGATLSLGSGAEFPLAVSNETDIRHALVATGFGYDSERRRDQAQTLLNVAPVVRDIRRAGSAALDLCSVAAGRLDGYFEKGTKPWDHAAGSLIVREAGGVVAGLRGTAESDDMIIASSPSLFSQLEKLLLK